MSNLIWGQRKRLPTKRPTVRQKAELGQGIRIYVDIGKYPDGSAGEIAVNMAKSGSVLRGMLDSWSLLASLALQYGCPASQLIRTFRDFDFVPCGLVTENALVKSCTSVVDYVVQVLAAEYPEQAIEAGPSQVAGRIR